MRDTVLQTGNWYAARSIDSGETWSYISPYTTFTASDGGFCCDQRAIYIPSADITVWLLQYSYSSTTQKAGQRIAIANGRAELKADTNGTWHSYYFEPQDFGRGLGEWMDFPDISYSNGFLYAASNMFNAASSFTDAVVWRMPLSELAAGGAVNYNYSRSATGLSGGASYRLTQNATSTMYFAEHRSTTSTRAYRWPDASGTISWTDITVPVYDNSGYVASAPNGVNWAGRADSRITGAWFRSTANEYGFSWHCAADASHPQCFVRTIRINAATNTLITTQDTWSATFQFMYPAAAVNSLGDVGVTTSIANATTLHPTNCYFIVDSCLTSFAGQSVSWFTGNNSPTTASRWGDYFSLQRNTQVPSTFVATGMTCRDGGANSNSEPHYVWFGREQNAPTYVNLAITSTPAAGAAITINVTDRNGLRNGTANFNRLYSPGQGYILTAPTSFTSGSTTYVFDRWVSNGGLQPIDERVLDVDNIGVVDDTAEAQFKIRRTLQIRSSNPTSGIAVTVSAADLNGNQNGSTPIDRLYKDGSTVTLTAPALNGINPFKQWVVNGLPQPIGQLATNVLVNGTETATAVYYTRTVGSYTQFCSGCPGTGGNVPVHTGSGTPEIGNVAIWRVTNARALSGAVLYVGASRTTYNGFPLPLALNIVNMGSCLLCVSVDVSINFATSGTGAAQLNVPIPNSVSLITSRLFTQAAIIDIGAPHTTPVVHTNALETRIGGNQ